MNIKTMITAGFTYAAFALTAVSVSAQHPGRMQLPISGITIVGDDITLEWDNYETRKDITNLELEEAFSLIGDWTPTPGLDLTKSCCGATVAVDGPRKFFRLFAAIARIRVTFDANGGVEPAFASKEVTPGTAYGPLPEYNLPLGQQKFIGWRTAEREGTLVSESTVVTNEADHTLWAYWASIENHPSIIVTNNTAHAFALPTATSDAPLEFSYVPYWAYGDSALPPGLNLDSSTCVLTVAQGTPVGRYWINLNAIADGKVIVVSQVTVEVRSLGTYWINEEKPDSRNDFVNIQNMYKTVEFDYPFAYRDLNTALTSDKFMYPQRSGIGSEQLPYVRPIASSVDIRAWRSRKTNNDNNLLHATVEVLPTKETGKVMYDNGTNPDADTWETTSGAVPLIPRGGTGVIEFRATNSHVSGTKFRVPWARFNVTWAPPETGLTGSDGHHDR